MIKSVMLDKAIEIAKEYCRGGGNNGSPAHVLESIYNKLKELEEDVRS